jgi:hypothetical protein
LSDITNNVIIAWYLMTSLLFSRLILVLQHHSNDWWGKERAGFIIPALLWDAYTVTEAVEFIRGICFSAATLCCCSACPGR